MTMAEIAEMTGVSQKTVSLVLNNPTTSKASAATREKILQIAAEHNYRTNRAAVELRKRENNLIGIQMIMPFQPVGALNAMSLQKKLVERGYYVVFSFHNSPDEVASAHEALLSHNPAGIIAWDLSPTLEKARIPTVLYRSKDGAYDSLFIDWSFYTNRIIRSSLQGGHERIADLLHTRESKQSMAAEYTKHGVELVNPDQNTVSLRKLTDFYKVAKELMRRRDRPTLFFTNDYIAEAVYKAAADLNLKIPEDVSVIGHDNLEKSALMTPLLSTFDLFVNDNLESLVDLLVARIKHPDKEVECRKMEIKYVERNSTRKTKRGNHEKDKNVYVD